MFFRRIIGAIAKVILRIFFTITYRLKVEGTENIPKEKNEPLIFCANHRSYLDPPLIECTTKRTVRFLAKDELHENKFIAFWMYVYEGIYVKRDSKDVKSLKETMKALKNNESIGIFPEGTRNGVEKGESAKEGAAFFAVRTGAKVIPIGISGGEKPFKKMIIRYGKPLDYSGRNKDELEKITEEIMEELKKLAK